MTPEGDGRGGPAGGRAPPMAGAVFRGAAVMLALRFAMRAIGFVSVLITARLLTPADFGVIGTVAIVTGLFAILAQIGLSEGLTRLQRVEPAHVATAWTMRLLVAAAISAGLFAAAPLAARLLEEPRLAEALRVAAWTPLVNALQSPGTMLLLRDMEFGREFRLRVAQKVLLVLCTVAGAWAEGSWWGLVVGGLAGAALGAAASYAMCPARPALSLSKRHDFLGFSLWTLVQGLAVYVASAADEIAVRRTSDTATFGLYHVSRDLGRVLVSEAVAPASAALLPGLARMQAERERFARAAAQAAGAAAIVAVALGLGVSATAPEAVALLLGPQWAGAAPILALTALGNVGHTLAGLHRGILAAIGKTHLSALLWVARAVVLVPVAILSAWWGGAVGVATGFAVASLLLAVLDYAVIFRLLRRPFGLVEVFARPLAAGGVMVLAVHLLPLPGGTPLALAALAKAGVGAVAYALALLALWWAVGRPDGAETALLERLPARLSRPFLPRRRAPAGGGGPPPPTAGG